MKSTEEVCGLLRRNLQDCASSGVEVTCDTVFRDILHTEEEQRIYRMAKRADLAAWGIDREWPPGWPSLTVHALAEHLTQ